VIASFACKQTRKLFEQHTRPKFLPGSLKRAALRKLVMIDAAARIEDLCVPPGNRLEKLRGSRSGQWSVRVNQQWRVCFRWRGGAAHDVEIVDYHD